MYYFVHPTEALEGNVKVPGSKSQTARGLILGTLAKGTTRVQNPMTSQNAAAASVRRWILPTTRSGSLRAPASRG